MFTINLVWYINIDIFRFRECFLPYHEDITKKKITTFDVGTQAEIQQPLLTPTKYRETNSSTSGTISAYDIATLSRNFVLPYDKQLMKFVSLQEKYKENLNGNYRNLQEVSF